MCTVRNQESFVLERLGARQMLSAIDLDWLGAAYPGMGPTESGGVSGVVNLSATYHRERNLFQILYPGGEDVIGGLQLAGTFNISIEQRMHDSSSRLPALRIEGLTSNANRHISRDGTACLCSPFVEKEFLEPSFAFRSYLEELVIPFLFGQLYYERENDWPWDQYSHGDLGILESYEPATSRVDVEECLSQLRRENLMWTRVRRILRQRGAVSDSTPCVCKLRHRMAGCHPRALRGLRQLRQDLRAMNIQL